MSEKVFDRTNAEQFCNIKQYCLDYQEELVAYYRPVFHRLIREEVNYDTIRKHFQIKEFLKYRYRKERYSFDNYLDFRQLGKDFLTQYLWYEFKDNNLIVKEK